MRPVAFGEALLAGTRLTLFSDDKLDRFFTVIKFWMDKTSQNFSEPSVLEELSVILRLPKLTVV
jgi:hypothetical protein